MSLGWRFREEGPWLYAMRLCNVVLRVGSSKRECEEDVRGGSGPGFGRVAGPAKPQQRREQTDSRTMEVSGFEYFECSR